MMFVSICGKFYCAKEEKKIEKRKEKKRQNKINKQNLFCITLNEKPTTMRQMRMKGPMRATCQ